MTEPASINQRSSLGVEVTPGTTVAATRQLQSVQIDPKIEFNTSFFRPSGIKYPTISMPGREWASGRMTGQPLYNELPYILSSLLGQATSVTDLTGGAYEWLWDVDSSAEAPPQTYTFEMGTTGSEQVMNHAWFSEWEITAPNSRESSMSGSVMGRRLDSLGSFATGLAEDTPVPILGSQFCLYIDDTSAALGTTKMLRNFNTSVRFPPRRQPVWTVDCDEPSFASLVEIEGGEPLASILLSADSQGEDLLAKARAGEASFIELHAEGPDINGTDSHYLEIQMAAMVETIDAYGNTDGVRSLPYRLRGVHDATWGKSHTVRVVTNLASL